ncbi:TPA: molecular chaperone DnaJ [Acinetobacter baumannii]
MKKWFSSDVNNLDDLKNEYRKLCFKHHPDMGGSTEDMQAINSEYEQLLKVLINTKADSNYSEKSTFKNRDEEIDAEIRLREVLEKLEILEGLEIERIGLWLYVSGNTKAHKEALKEAGLKWAHARKLWIYVGTECRGRGNKDMDELRAKYGNEKVKTRSKIKKIA